MTILDASRKCGSVVLRPLLRRLGLLGLLLLLALQTSAAVRISEFMAENDGGLADGDGETPDWIELFNDGVSPVNLAGWRLTDTPTNLAKWIFPATNLPSGGLLIVFASGKNRVVPGAELHTSFQIDSGGGWLALVQPDGATIAHSITYSGQRANVSFGLALSNVTTTVLVSNAAARYLIPASGALGTTWTAPAFDDSTWSNTIAPLTYLAASMPGPPVLSVDFSDDEQTSPAREMGAADTEAGFNIMTLGANPTNFSGISVQLSALDGGVLDDRDRTSPIQGGLLTFDQIYDDFIFVIGTTNGNGARIQITGLTPLQNYLLTVWSFDASSTGQRLSDWIETASGVTRVITNGFFFDGSVLPTRDTDDTFGGTVSASASGALTIEGRRNGGTSHGVFLNALRLAPISGTTTTGNMAALYGSNSSAYVRLPFNLANPNVVSSLTLRVRYNDGFVAYLNGQQVAARNAPASPQWNAVATAIHPAVVAEDVTIITPPGLLVSGTNVLALHGLNISANDGDFTLAPELLAQQTTELTNRYFQPATPGSNNTIGFTGLVADTKFSMNRGFYTTSFPLIITNATPGAEIRFTTNGSAPSPSNGAIYTAPIPITGQSFVRAAAFKAGLVPSDVDTHSYLFLRDVLRQSNNIPGYPTVWPQASYTADYEMDSNVVKHPVYGPTLSNDLRSIKSLCIVSDQNGLWNSSTGIYPNPQSIGLAWERAASVELISSNSHTEFATTCKIQIHGNASRDNTRTPKHSIGLGFNSDYGPTRLNYDWFGGGVDSHDGIVLRSCGFVDGWSGRYADFTLFTSTETGETFRGARYRPENTCYLRDAWVKDSFGAMGWSASRSAYVHLYLNGLYWGLYEPSEHINATWYSQRHGGPDGAWDVVVGEDNNGPPVIVDGSGVDWTNVLNLVNAGITTESAYQSVAALVDLDNLIDYMMVHIFAESEDWPRHNWFAAHRRATNGIPGTKFFFTVWDQELTLDRLVRRNRIDVGGTGGEVYSPARVYQQLRNWPEFRLRFADRVHKHLFNGGTLTPSNNVARLLEKAALIRSAVVGESARWGDARETAVPAGQVGTGQTFTRNEWWQPEIDKLATNFFQKLTADNVARFRAGSLYPTVGTPSFSQFGGGVPAGFGLTMSHTNAVGTIYFTTDGRDPRTYGTGAVGGGAQSFSAPVVINTPTLVRARVLSGAIWSALVEAVFYPPQDLSKLALTEIMYNPPAVGLTNGDDFEFIELKNTGTNTLNLSGLNFSGVGFTFTNGTLLTPGGFCVLVRNPVAFADKYPGVTFHGVFSGGLNSAGESLTLSHALGATIFSVTYDDDLPWPAAADNFGFSLVPRNPGASQAPDQGGDWRASTNPGGSPGADDPPFTIPGIVINEVLTHSDPAPPTDTIELFNPTMGAVNIGGWFLTDDRNVPHKFRIPNGTMIAGGGYASFNETHFNTTPGTNGSFSLGSHGESVYLFSGGAASNLTGYSHGFDFGAAPSGVSFGRYVNSVGEESFPAQISRTPGGVNAGPRVGPVVFGEIHYHPAPGGDEFIELQSIVATNVPLFDPARPTNTWRVSGLGFDFPTNLTLAPNSLLLLVGTNPAIFRAKYAVPTNVVILGPWTGSLQDSGERLKLERPDAPDTNGSGWIVIEELRYNDKAPWPAAADGSGPSLQRFAAGAYADDPINWTAAGPTPGQSLATADTDGDGMPDLWELANGTQPFVSDADGDLDGDGSTNFQEYLAGTNPNDAESYLKVDNISFAGNLVTLQFFAISNRTYTVLARDVLDAGSWLPIATVSALPTSATVTVTNTVPGATRFYRLGTP